MGWVAQHAALGLAALALCAAAVRIVTAAAPAGLERIVAAAPIAAAAAGIESMALGIAGLGSSPVALSVAAVLTWVASRRLPARGRSPGDELRAWWAARERRDRLLAGAGAGAGAALGAWLLRHPYVGNDGVTYHLNTVVDFVRSGTPTDLVTSTYAFPTANHPLTNELLMSWSVSIARSFAPVTLWTPLMLALAGLAAWVGLRALRVSPLPSALAVAALCTLPLNLEHLGEPNSDTPALAWLLCAGALSAGAGRRPALLVPALVAGGLALGTKTTVLGPLAIALAAGAWAARDELRKLARPLALGAAAAIAVGSYWYLRNLVDHGFPLWPFLATSWSDPLPRLLELFSHGFLERPGATLAGRTGEYVETLAGALVLVPAALLVPLLARRREVALAAAVSGLALLMWSMAPITGLGDVLGLERFSISALRYLLPALSAVLLTVALASRVAGIPRRLATAVLALALAWNLVAAVGLGYPFLPRFGTLLAGALIGGAVALFLSRERRARRLRSLPRPAGAIAAAALCGALLAAPANGWVQRHGAVNRTPDAELVNWFAARGLLGGDEPIAFTRIRYAPLAGDRLRRRLDLVAEREPCARARSRGWVVFGAVVRLPVRGQTRERFPELAPVERCRFIDEPAYEGRLFRVYAPAGGPSSARSDQSR